MKNTKLIPKHLVGKKILKFIAGKTSISKDKIK